MNMNALLVDVGFVLKDMGELLSALFFILAKCVRNLD
jgi:hypothetical protein